jgi:hypothetical protein
VRSGVCPMDSIASLIVLEPKCTLLRPKGGSSVLRFRTVWRRPIVLGSHTSVVSSQTTFNQLVPYRIGVSTRHSTLRRIAGCNCRRQTARRPLLSSMAQLQYRCQVQCQLQVRCQLAVYQACFWCGAEQVCLQQFPPANLRKVEYPLLFPVLYQAWRQLQVLYQARTAPTVGLVISSSLPRMAPTTSSLPSTHGAHCWISDAIVSMAAI